MTSNNRPAYSCGDAYCCLGDDYPACQDTTTVAHYEDEQHPSSPCTFTD